MTNQDILRKNVGLIPFLHLEKSVDQIINAMDEYAKQFGENLIGWLNDNDFKFTNWKDNMQSDSVNGGARMHASEIIDLFIAQQTQTP